MRGKLALIGDYLSQHALALEGRSVVIALPALAEDGRPLAEAEHGFIARLTAEAEQARIKLSFVFADTLDALEEALGPFTVKELVNPRQALAAAAVVCAAALTFGLWSLLAHAPIRLAFEPPAPADAAGPDDAAPQRARYDAKSDKLKLLGPCFDAQREPMVVGGETLVLKVRAEDALPFASRVRPMRLFIASVSRSADPVVLDAGAFPLAWPRRFARPRRDGCGDPDRADQRRSPAFRAGDTRSRTCYKRRRSGAADDTARLERRVRARRHDDILRRSTERRHRVSIPGHRRCQSLRRLIEP